MRGGKFLGFPNAGQLLITLIMLVGFILLVALKPLEVQPYSNFITGVLALMVGFWFAKNGSTNSTRKE